MAAGTVPGKDEHLQERGGFELLARINAREQQIEALRREARESAARTVKEAERAAADIVASREREAAGVFARARAEILDAARREAEAIRAVGASRAAAVHDTPRERVERTAGRLLRLVLPGQRREGAGS